MPKVVHVLRKFEPSEWGGTESHIVGLIPELERLGWLSEVHAPAEAGTDGQPIVQVGGAFRTFRAHYPWLGLPPGGRDRMVASGGNLVTLDEPLRLLADRRASILHVHTQRRLGGVVRFAARRRGIPYAVTIHGPLRAGGVQGAAVDTVPRSRGVDLGAAYGFLVGARRVVEDADLVFVLNERERAAWEPERRGRHLECIPHGVRTDPATAAERRQARRAVPGLGDAPFACVIGRLDPVKGQDLALAAFERDAQTAGLHLVLAGADTDRAFAQALRARAARLPARVHLVGGVSPAVARALLAEARVALLPSRAEAFGIVLLEAWAEGTPALFSDVGGLADLARGNEVRAGSVPAVTEEGWAAALRAFLTSPAALEEEARRGPARVAARYGWRGVAERLAGAYDRACAR